MWEFVDKVVYINLDSRSDRRDIMARFFEDAKIPLEKVVRFSAVQDPSNGILGCAKSHIGVLNMARENGWNSVLVLEDDLEWFDFENNYKVLTESVEKVPNYDVFMLTGKYIRTEGLKIHMAMFSNAYIVKNHYYPTLIDNMETGLIHKTYWAQKNKQYMLPNERLQYNKIYAHVYNVDVYWIALQLKHNWFGILACRQTPSYSNINKQFFLTTPMYGYMTDPNEQYDVQKFFLNNMHVL